MAVYTHISKEKLNTFIDQYPIGAVIDFQGIEQGIENTNYILTTNDNKYILTIFEKRVAKEDLPFYLEYMNFLFTHGINVPKPIKTSTGDILTTYDGKPAVILSFLNGRDIKLDHIQANHCAELGRFLAKMHQTSDKSSLTHSNKLSLDDWFDLFNKCQTSAPDDFSDMIKTITSELKFLKENWPSGLSQGLIHADLFPDNVFFEQDKLSGVIDFYFSCTDFYSYDVAICLNAWCFDHQNYTYDLQKAKSFLTAYQNTRPLSDADKTAFPILCRGAALRFLLTRLYDWFTPPKDALVKPKNPEEYYKKLLFHQKIAHFEEYLTS